MMNNTHFAQWIPPTAIHYVTGTWTDAAGAVTGTIAKHKAATAETVVVTVPVVIPSNSVALQGAKLTSIEVDYELLLAAATSVTAVLHKIVRGADTAVAVASHPAITQDLTAATDAASEDQHRLTVTLTTPVWIDNDDYYLLELSFVCGDTVTVDVLSAVVNYTFRA
jgi:creatinine amidohydrolase/Fe(II)-dependent formamide hydrolase-like protein